MDRFRWTRYMLAALLCVLVPMLALSQQASYYVLDGFGGVHAGGDAPAITPPPPYFGFDIARDLTYVPVGKRIGPVDVVGDGVLVLDAFGGCSRGGRAAALDDHSHYAVFRLRRRKGHRRPQRAAAAGGAGGAHRTALCTGRQ